MHNHSLFSCMPVQAAHESQSVGGRAIASAARGLAFRRDSRNVSPVGRLSVVAAIVALALPARAEVFGSTFRSTTWGVEMTLPRGWEISEQTSYPGVLARGLQPKSGARLTLGVQRLAPDEDPRAYVARVETALATIGYHLASAGTHPTGALLLESSTPDKKKVIRQAYVARGATVYILTLAVTAELANAHLRPFDETLRRLEFALPVPEPPTPTLPFDAPEAPTP
jgi:hypothetical protein